MIIAPSSTLGIAQAKPRRANSSTRSNDELYGKLGDDGVR
jgi:hypothetical protein